MLYMLTSKFEWGVIMFYQAQDSVNAVSELVYHVGIIGGIGWFLLGLLFVYLEIWMRIEVSPTIFGPFNYAKKDARTISFAILSYIAIYVMWVTTGVYLEINGEKILDLQKGSPNAMVCIIGYASSSIFSALTAKYRNIKSNGNGNGNGNGGTE